MQENNTHKRPRNLEDTFLDVTNESSAKRQKTETPVLS